MWDGFFRQQAFIGITRSCMCWYVRKDFLLQGKISDILIRCARKEFLLWLKSQISVSSNIKKIFLFQTGNQSTEVPDFVTLTFTDLVQEAEPLTEPDMEYVQTFMAKDENPFVRNNSTHR